MRNQTLKIFYENIHCNARVVKVRNQNMVEVYQIKKLELHLYKI